MVYQYGELSDDDDDLYPSLCSYNNYAYIFHCVVIMVWNFSVIDTLHRMINCLTPKKYHLREREIGHLIVIQVKHI